MCPFIVFRGPKRTEPSAGFDVMAELGTTSAAADSVTEGVKEATFGRNAGWGWRVGRRGVKEVNVLTEGFEKAGRTRRIAERAIVFIFNVVG